MTSARDLAEKFCKDNDWHPGGAVPPFFVFVDKLESLLQAAFDEIRQQELNKRIIVATDCVDKAVEKARAQAYEECAKMCDEDYYTAAQRIRQRAEEVRK